jgi:hypothetical protein
MTETREVILQPSMSYLWIPEAEIILLVMRGCFVTKYSAKYIYIYRWMLPEFFQGGAAGIFAYTLTLSHTHVG